MLLLKDKNFKDIVIIILISFFVVLTVVFPLLNKYFPRTHDTNLYMTWLYEFDQSFRQGNLLPRWQANLWFGYGAPIFNYIQPFFYYLSEGFHLVGFSLVVSIKIVIALSVVFSFIFMFLLIKELWGKWAALVLASLYVLLPYRFGLIYIRGDFSEYLATALFPLILFSFYKFLKTEKLAYFLLSSISIALLFLTHNVQTILFLPVLVIYILIFFPPSLSPSFHSGSSFRLRLHYGGQVGGNRWKNLKKILKSGLAIIYGSLLAGFFWIPAFFERKFIQTDRLAGGRYDFHNHFIGLKELLIPIWGPDNFYQVGAIGLLIIFFAIYVLFRHKKIDFNSKHILFFLLLIIVCLFLTTRLSIFIWENLHFLAQIQFPWRLLSLAVFGLAILGSIIVVPEFYRLITKNPTKKYFIVLTLFIFIFSLALFVIWNPSKPLLRIPARQDFQYSIYYQLFDESNVALIDFDLLKIENEELVQKSEINIYAAIPDVLPKGVDYKVAKEKADDLVKSIVKTVEDKGSPYFIDKLVLLSGEAKILESKILVEEYKFDLVVEKEAKLRINTFWFPGWRAYVDDKEVMIDKNNSLGLMDVNIPEGQHVLRVEFHNTPLRNMATFISLMAFLIFIVIFLFLLIKKVLVGKRYAN